MRVYAELQVKRDFAGRTYIATADLASADGESPPIFDLRFEEIRKDGRKIHRGCDVTLCNHLFPDLLPIEKVFGCGITGARPQVTRSAYLAYWARDFERLQELLHLHESNGDISNLPEGMDYYEFEKNVINRCFPIWQSQAADAMLVFDTIGTVYQIPE